MQGDGGENPSNLDPLGFLRNLRERIGKTWGRLEISTLPETNISPENRPLEKEIPIGHIIFRCYVSFRECTTLKIGS